MNSVPALVGLAVSSHTATVTVDVVFEHVKVSQWLRCEELVPRSAEPFG